MKLLMILCLELIVVLVLLILCAKVFPDNPITRSITSLIIEDPQVVLDAGHGGYDSGSNFGDIYEKNVTLALTKKIGTALENKGIKVAYTRTSDEVSWPADEVADLTRRVEILCMDTNTFAWDVLGIIKTSNGTDGAVTIYTKQGNQRSGSCAASGIAG